MRWLNEMVQKHGLENDQLLPIVRKKKKRIVREDE